MPLTSQEQNKIVQLLGYGGKSIQAGSVIYDKVMNDRLHSLPPGTEELVRSYLGKVKIIEDRMDKAPARLAAREIGDIKTNLDELPMLRKERRKIAKEIAAHLDIPFVAVSSGSIGVSF